MALSSPYKPFRLISPLKARQLHKALKNLKLSVICGLLTILVLRGALGAGKFGTPAKDFEEIKYQFERVQRLRAGKHASRVFTEVVEDRERPVEAIQAQSTEYDALADAKDKLHGRFALMDSNLAVKSIPDVTMPHALSPKFSDSDSQRRALLRANPNHVRRKPNLMLVTGYQASACENPTGNHYRRKFLKNKVNYCKLHGIEILYDSALLEAELSGFSAKLHLLRKLALFHPHVEWFWWMDNDALFIDMALELPLEEYDNYNVVLHGWDGIFYKQKTQGGPTSGSFLIRNCQRSFDMMDKWVAVEPEDRESVDAGKPLPISSAGESNSDDKPMWAHLLINEERNLVEKVLEESMYLHGYWERPVEQSEEKIKMNHDAVSNERRPFMIRFIGHNLCERDARVGGDHSDLYLKYMERAFDFADSQVLQLDRFRHRFSSSSALHRLRGGRDGIMV